MSPVNIVLVGLSRCRLLLGSHQGISGVVHTKEVLLLLHLQGVLLVFCTTEPAPAPPSRGIQVLQLLQIDEDEGVLSYLIVRADTTLLRVVITTSKLDGVAIENLKHSIQILDIREMLWHLAQA